MSTLCPRLKKWESWLLVILGPLLILSCMAFAVFPRRMLQDVDTKDGATLILLREFVPEPVISLIFAWACIALSLQWWQALGRIRAQSPIFCFEPTGVSLSAFGHTRQFKWNDFERIVLQGPSRPKLVFRLKSEMANTLANFAMKLFLVSRVPSLRAAEIGIEFESVLQYLETYAPADFLQSKHGRLGTG